MSSTKCGLKMIFIAIIFVIIVNGYAKDIAGVERGYNRLNEYISHYETLDYDHQQTRASHHRARRSVTKDHFVHLKFKAHGRDFHLRLKRDLFTFSNKLEIIDSNGPLDVSTDHIYEGDVIGDRNSYVFGSILDGVFEGKIITERDAYYVEHAKRYFPTNFTQLQSLELRSTDDTFNTSTPAVASSTTATTTTTTMSSPTTTATTKSPLKKSKSIEDHHDDVVKGIGFHSVIYKDSHVEDVYKEAREGALSGLTCWTVIKLTQAIDTHYACQLDNLESSFLLRMDDNLEDTHLCIKCKRTIVGLGNYIEHRKQNCSTPTTSAAAAAVAGSPTKITTSTPQAGPEVTPAISFEPFSFNEPEPPHASSHGGKTGKALADSYELPYELEADVFFSSLQLQSVQSAVGHNVPTTATSGGKTVHSQHSGPLTRQKSLQQETETTSRVNWLSTAHASSGEHFLKDGIFKSMNYGHESAGESEEEEEEDEVDIEVEDDNDDDEDYDPLTEAHASREKWKLTPLRQSPPVVPLSHTGGKWKPENRPFLRVAHCQLSRASPTWDDNLDETDGQHPPADHTKGKWLPGTKLQRLEYKEEVELAKSSKINQQYWCNICCRKLKTKIIYEHHLKTSYHLKRAEPELQLEKAAIKELPKSDIRKSLALAEFKPLSITVAASNKKRKRRCTYLKCSLCKHVMTRHLIGKHLISHYHYRRMQLQPGVSLPLILENIHAIVLQSPFQCRPCRFYANTEEMFLLHWNSASHLDASEGPGRFWCSYCQFECEDNHQMRRHLLGPEHKEVLLAINRSVPICISKKLSLECGKCGQIFRFNFELRRHHVLYHPGVELMGTASDSYQSKFKCMSCAEVLHSKIALHRHEKFKHFVNKYFCSICNLEFFSPCQARRHRKTLEHKQKAMTESQKLSRKEKTKALFETSSENRLKTATPQIQHDLPTTSLQAQLALDSRKSALAVTSKCHDCPFAGQTPLELSLHIENHHINNKHKCILCSKKFATAQELGRHSRLCKPLTIVQPEAAKLPADLPAINNEKGEKIWLCDLCDFKSPLRSEILYHRIFHSYVSVAKNQLLPCPLCEKTFRKQSLRFHLHNHTKEKLFQCHICSASFSRPNNLKDHIKNIHLNKKAEAEQNIVEPRSAGGQTFPCAACDKVFKNKHSLKMHHLSHHVTDSAAAKDSHLLKCPHENCEYSSVSKSLLKTHLHSHAVESFECPEKDCNYVGKSKLHLKRHLQSHLPANVIKHFACSECKFKTNIKSHLKRHMRQHTGEKPFACPHCDFHSKTWENLRKHILKTDKHAGKFVFECQKCQEVELLADNEEKQENGSKNIFKTNSHHEYQQHLKNVHKNGK